MGVIITQKGSFKHTEKMFNNMKRFDILHSLNKYGKMGVEALSASTPINTGKTAGSWAYEIGKTRTGYSIYWKNSNINDGVNVAILLQLGHGTGTGGYVQGIDYINPVLKPIFEDLANEAWQEVTRYE